jgi:hypothetical protein
VNSKITRDSVNVKAELRLTAMNKLPLADSAIDVELVNGKKIISRQRIKTDRNGVVGLNFSSPGATKPVIVLQNSSKTKKAIIPVILNRPENTDVQFMPEGGSMIAGLPARIGFKAIGEDGRGALVSGVVVDDKDSIVGSFRSLHNGMGSFYMQPQAGENYRAKVNLPGAVIRYYPLPSVKGSGTLLQIKNLPGTDSLDIIVAATPDYANASYYIIGKARGLTCYAALADLSKDPYQRSRIAKSKFPQGVAHFILMTAAGQPLNERLVYVDRPDSLHIDIEPDRQVYNPRDSITLHIRVNDNTGKPATGNFSMTVTDDAQVRGDSVSDENIITRILLTSDLRGYVENPKYYFRNSDTAKAALDNLLLTQGWVSYEPPAGKPPFEAETEFKIRGRVNNVFNKGLKKTEVVMLSVRPLLTKDTITDNDGRFVFDHFPRIDTPIFGLKTNKRNFNVNIDVDETPPPVFVLPVSPRTNPWYVNTDTPLMNFAKRNTQMQQLQYYPGGGRILKEVKIRAKKTIKGSYNLNGPGNADVVIDEKELEEAGKKTFLDLFQEKVKGFRQSYFRTPDWLSRGEYSDVYRFESRIRNASESDWYFIYDKPVILIVDGVDIEDVYPPPFNFAAFMGYMKSHSAEDIKGIEVNFSSKYNAHYLRSGKWMEEPLAEPKVRDFAFVEITTRSGAGAMIRNTPGMYLYKPLPLTWPKQFYKPKYIFKDTSKQVDLRSTIDWEPNIATDSSGHATVSFYARSTSSTYTVVIEGTDLKGNVAYKRRRIIISPAKKVAK